MNTRIDIKYYWNKAVRFYNRKFVFLILAMIFISGEKIMIKAEEFILEDSKKNKLIMVETNE